MVISVWGLTWLWGKWLYCQPDGTLDLCRSVHSSIPQVTAHSEGQVRAGPVRASVPSGALGKDILSFSERALCGWENSTLNCCSPERSHPEDKIKPRTWQGRQSQGSEPPRIIESHYARSLPTSGIFLDCWSQVALISLSSWEVSPNHPGTMFTVYGDLWRSGLKVWELSRWCLGCPG